ncbi:MAG: hypothetical protein AUJ12_06360 [Alphaproteobacteria bacterium CG1_02_46_17]|nr:MAG: hypothetical protein AUJ12_06360 [Alphaproteobacteria bacterium CG1_02_46_17]
MRRREGVFTCPLWKNKILLIWPDYAPDVPDLAGGGIDEGETEVAANEREFFEETGFMVSFGQMTPLQKFDQEVLFYADVQNEFWIYKQTYYLFDQNLDKIYFSGERDTPENGKMKWVNVEDIQNLPIHFMHQKALKMFDLMG